MHGPACRLPDTTEDNLLRIAQEAITNAIRHSGARHVKLELIYGESSVQLRVADDGCGFDPAKMLSPAAGHFGCQGMRERAEQIGARFTLQSRPGSGTEIEVDLPLRDVQIGQELVKPESVATT